nr:hypothetical protein GCM10020185_64680 [Pseudomonas brassicacearum subsp. brassicacearum]
MISSGHSTSAKNRQDQGRRRAKVKRVFDTGQLDAVVQQLRQPMDPQQKQSAAQAQEQQAQILQRALISHVHRWAPSAVIEAAAGSGWDM